MASTSTSTAAAKSLGLFDLPYDVLVSVFAAAKDPRWTRETFTSICMAWNEIWKTKDSSPLREELVINTSLDEPAKVIAWIVGTATA